MWCHVTRGRSSPARPLVSLGAADGFALVRGAGGGGLWGPRGRTKRKAGSAPGPRRQHTERAPRPERSDAVVPGRHSGRHRVGQEERRGLRGVRGR